MIILSILAIVLIVLILIQTPKGTSQILSRQIGAKSNRSFLTKVTWAIAAGVLLVVLVLI